MTKNIYTFKKQLEKRYPQYIISISDDIITLHNPNNSKDIKKFKFFYSNIEHKFMFFEIDSGKKININKIDLRIIGKRNL